jgi:pyruvate/2-oxoglutarate dehydrogenase complex dihydrolipoamide acyltransferase (E2) component
VTDVLLPVALLACILVVSILTLAIVIRNLRSSRRSVALGEDRYELQRDQHERLALLREERQTLLEELERQSREREQLMELLEKTPQQLVEDLEKEREVHLEARERIEYLEQERHQLMEQLEREHSPSNYRLRGDSPPDAERKEAVEQPVEPSPRRTGRISGATDAAKRKAEELGVDLSQVEGSGANGRIRMKDVLNATTRRTS